MSEFHLVDYVGHAPHCATWKGHAYNTPAVCEASGCRFEEALDAAEAFESGPGPKLVAKLEAAERCAEALRAVLMVTMVDPPTDVSGAAMVQEGRDALAAWLVLRDSARSEKEE